MDALSVALLSGLLAAGPFVTQEGSAESSNKTPPRLVKQTPPVYPPEALRLGTEGIVLLEVLIDEGGKVQSARVVKSIPGLDDAAIQTVKKWKFTAAQTDGKFVSSRAQVPVAFRIFGRPRS